MSLPELSCRAKVVHQKVPFGVGSSRRDPVRVATLGGRVRRTPRFNGIALLVPLAISSTDVRVDSTWH